MMGRLRDWLMAQTLRVQLTGCMQQPFDDSSQPAAQIGRQAGPQPPLATPVQFVRGVGPKRAELLERLGIRTVEDLLFYLPRDLLDLSQVTPVDRLKDGELQTVCGRVVDIDGRELAGGKSLSAVLLDCDGRYLRGVWFNQTWVQQKFQPRARVLFSGKPKRQSGRWEISHPRVQWIDETDESTATGGLLPRYGLTDGLKMDDLRRLMKTVVEQYADFVPDVLPAAFREQAGLVHIAAAFRALHTPTTADQFAAGRHRLIFQDLLEFQLGIALRRRVWRQSRGAPRFPATPKIDARIRRLFPFELTAGQNQAIREICADLESGWAMHRLLQADVGAGKTVVAIYAMLIAVAAGYQAVCMAPTELLASQHWHTIDRMLAHSRVNRLALTGRLTAAERRDALARIASGEVQLIIGTQAVIQQDVRFARLGLVVIDEQHKFGVMQRARFGGNATPPHTLVMTATPIPRSLCLTQFGDLDLSIVRDLPPGRQRVITSRVAGSNDQARVWEFIRQKLRSGRQAYVVCPRIAPTAAGDGGDDGLSAEQVYRRLADQELRDFRVSLVHGQLDSDLQAAAMAAFRAGHTQVLVSTTVVEVGVDVANATLMVIRRAESFGLSQLHQLRGRVSRGSFQGYCFLFAETELAESNARLEALANHASGFDVAEVDFQMRGPGDILGTRQHGDLPLKVADLVRDGDALAAARQTAFDLVASGAFDGPEFAPLKNQVLDRFGRLFDLAGSG